MMTRQVVGLFDTQSDAQSAVRALQSAGICQADISVVASAAHDGHEAIADGDRASGANTNDTATGATTGAVSGAMLGGVAGVLVGLGLLTIPGIGPVLAAGPLAAAISTTGAAAGAGALGAGIGAVAGGLLGALIGTGIPEQDANVYAEGIRRGGTLVVARVPAEQVDLAIDIMNRGNLVNIEQRGEELRAGGWRGFDEHAGPHDQSTVGGSMARERQVGGAPTRRMAMIGGRARLYDYRQPDVAEGIGDASTRSGNVAGNDAAVGDTRHKL